MKKGVSMKYIVLLLSVVTVISLSGSNISVSNVRLMGKNTTNKTVYIAFDLSWDYSWRQDSVLSGPKNWDAAWVFVKFRRNPVVNYWEHVVLNFVNGTGTGDGHIPAPGSVIRCSNDNGTGGAFGVFIYADRNITPRTVNYNNVRLLWNYGAQGVNDDDSLDICVFAIEMVYIPQAPFYAGCAPLVTNGQFEAGNTNTPFLISSENALTLGGTSASNLSNHNSIGMNVGDDFNYSTTVPLPASFPKGFNRFYIMKYEITQQQYAEFLNKLSNLQHVNRFPNASANRHGIAGSWPNYSSSFPYVPCNYISYADLLAYLDWAALRPITELEYEKACRPPYPTNGTDDYAWGDGYIQQATGINNSGAPNEVPSNAHANCAYGNHASVQGPLRSGCFGMSLNRRQNDSLGASYWGVFELSGNLWESVVSVGNANGRNFTGLHGDGILDPNGNANTANWNINGMGLRGGSYGNNIEHIRVSCRVNVNTNYGRHGHIGGRGGRNAHPVIP